MLYSPTLQHGSRCVWGRRRAAALFSNLSRCRRYYYLHALVEAWAFSALPRLITVLWGDLLPLLTGPWQGQTREWGTLCSTAVTSVLISEPLRLPLQCQPPTICRTNSNQLNSPAPTTGRQPTTTPPPPLAPDQPPPHHTIITTQASSLRVRSSPPPPPPAFPARDPCQQPHAAEHIPPFPARCTALQQ